jgi:ribosome biogenesis GTPase
MAEVTGLVVAAHGRRGTVELMDGSRHRYLLKGRKLSALCGDHVTCSPDAHPPDLLVTGIRPRANTLARAGRRGQAAEPLAANLTRLLVVLAPRPAPDLFLLDRYLCAAELIGCHPALVWNKHDLERWSAGALADYLTLDYAVVALSARTGAGLAELTGLLAGQVGALVGQSGVGKSSLINALVPGAAAAIGELSAAGDVGRHTTTAALMYRVGEGRLIDTPGVRDFIPALDPRQCLALGFREIRLAAERCRFADCRHLAEPDCAVKTGVAAGSILARRYESYRRLLDDIRPRP